MLFSIKHLSISFNKNSVLKDVSFSIPSTGLHAIVGKSGCGKSTLLNVLFGIQKATKGTVEFMSRNILKLKDKEFSRFHEYDVSMVFQHYNLLPSFTSFDNVLLPLLIRGEDKKKASKKVDELFEKFNLINIKNQIIDTLSGGEKQRVAILRCLIIEPKVLLCDEPTGALDKANSILVMDMLKEISKTKAVVMVSHNKELVKKYANRIITMQNGTIISDFYKEKIIDSNISNRKKEHKHIQKWKNLFVRKHLKKSKTKNVFSIVSIAFGLLSIFVVFGFINGSQLSEEKALLNNYAVATSQVSIKTYFEIENSPLTFEKNVRPSLEEIDEAFLDTNYLRFEPNLDYAFSPYPNGFYENERIESFQMVPVINDCKNLTDVFINKEMANIVKDKTIKIGDKITITNSSIYSLATNDETNPFTRDTFSYKIDLEVKEIVNEFSFLNTPKIYYSYDCLVSYLKGVKLKNLSLEKNDNLSIYRYISESKPDDPISSYSLYCFVNDEKYIRDYFDLIKKFRENNNHLQIDSIPFEIKESYHNFMSSFSDALFVFIIIAFICINLIIGMLSLSSFLEHKKESAILTCLGARNKSIVSIYLKQNLLLFFASFFIALLTMFPIQFLINFIIEKEFGLISLINIPFLIFHDIYLGLPIIIFTISFLVLILFILIPIFLYRKISIVDELRDE